jgi:hypothetical protein
MDVLQLFGDAARFALRAFIVLAPLLAWQWIALWSRPWRRRAGGLADPTIIAGMMVGIAMLAVSFRPEMLDLDAIVSVGGFWDRDTGDFLALARGFVLHAPAALVAALETDDWRRNLQAWLVLAMALWLARAVVVLVARPPYGVPRFVAGELATFVASAIGTVYLGPLMFWSINQLNFWLFLIAILLIQDYRYDEPPLFGRLVGRASHHHIHPPMLGAPVPDPD